MTEPTFYMDKNVCSAALSALQYYSLFQYPLKAEEIYGNLPVKSSLASLLIALEDMEEATMIYMYDGYYGIDKDIKRLVIRRKEANQLASSKKKKAINIGRLIYKFPFVRFVGISGSLSKGYADSKSDFDFFIITSENRLWICRTLLHLFKKMTFLLGQQHKFCMNYFIDLHNLEIDEKNRFTAIELASLIPVSGYDSYMKLKAHNRWLNTYLPNGYVSFYHDTSTISDDKSFVKTIAEFLCNNVFPDKVNRLLMALTDKKWRKKWTKKNYPMKEYNIAFKTTLHISKNHPANHQKRVLEMMAQLER